MPCDTRIKTSVVDLAKVDRKRLAAVLAAMGWSVAENVTTRLLAFHPSGYRLNVEGNEATLETLAYGNRQPAEVLADIRRAYAARTLTDVSARFGFKVQGTEQLLGGAQRVMLRR
jgi:hypothetical protein